MQEGLLPPTKTRPVRKPALLPFGRLDPAVSIHGSVSTGSGATHFWYAVTGLKYVLRSGHNIPVTRELSRMDEQCAVGPLTRFIPRHAFVSADLLTRHLGFLPVAVGVCLP